MTGKNGVMVLEPDLVRNVISNCRPPKKSAFLIPEFDKYLVSFSSGTDRTDTFEFASGIGTELCKEEWRGEMVGNLFYPKKFGKFKPIIHINGSVQLLQDARSILLAREGGYSSRFFWVGDNMFSH